MAVEITCLIADDEVVREGLRLLLSRAPNIRLIGEVSDGAGAVALVERRRPHVVIMDVRMPGSMDGLKATKLISERTPNAAVLILTAYSERSVLGRWLESGARGYILKEAPHVTLLRAIEKVAGGESFVDAALMPTFLTGKELNDLTAREREILQLLADRMSSTDVAARLLISQETVKTHVEQILADLETDTSTHAVAIVREAIIDY